MKIAILGASSFLGKTLLRDLKAAAHAVDCFSRTNRFEATQSWTCYNFPSHPLSYPDLVNYDVIYYCAGAGIQPKHQDSNQQIYELNAFEPIRLFTALKERNYQGKLITFGSYFEIGNHPEERCYTEQELATHNNPLPNAYCTAKNLLTRFINTEQLQAENVSFSFQHFILTNIYGAEENSNRLIPYIVQSSLKRETLTFTSGVQQRQYTHISDVSNFLCQNLDKNSTGIFNLTDPTVLSVRTMIEKVLAIVQEELNIEPQATFGTLNKRDISMKYLGLNTSHLQNCFNFAPSISLEKGIREYIVRYNQVTHS